VFAIAGIEYRRADWGILRGNVQVYEINANPHITGNPGTTNSTRVATDKIGNKKLCNSLATLERGTKKNPVKISGKLLAEWRNGKKWCERAERRPRFEKRVKNKRNGN
jgi:hypothetical protein